ncbi:MAG: O-antigen ligase family protein [Nitrospirota bacterium]
MGDRERGEAGTLVWAWCLIGLAAGVLLLFTWRTYESFNVPKEAWLKIGTSAVWAGILLRSLQSGTIRLPWGPIVWTAMAYWMWGWLSLMVSVHPSLTVRYQLYLLYFLLAMLLVPVVLKRVDDIGRVWSGVGILGGAVALLAIAQYFGFDYEQGIRMLPLSQPVAKVEVYSTIGNPNYLAAVLAFLLPVMMGLAIARGLDHRPFACALFSICAAATAVALILSRSKGGLVAVIGGLAVFWLLWGRWAQWRPKKMILVGAGLGGVALLFLLAVGWWLPKVLAGHQSPLVLEWGKLSRLSWEDPSVKGRLLIWQTAIQMIAAHPVTGIGAGNFGAQYQPYRALVFERLPDPAATYPADEPSFNETGQAHNDYLQIAAETGLPGLGLFIGLTWFCFRDGWRRIREPNDPQCSPLLLCGILSGTAAVLTHATVDFPMNHPVPALLFWLAVGTLSAAGEPSRLFEWRSRLPVVFGRFRWAVAGGVLLAASWFIFQAIRPVVAEAYHRDAWLLMDRQRWVDAIPVIEQGLRWEPHHSELTLYLGVASYQLGNLQRSRAAYEHYHSLYTDFQTLYNLGLIAAREGRFSMAEDYFLQALRYKPTLWQAAEALSLVAEKTGRPDDASQWRRQVARLGGISR